MINGAILDKGEDGYTCWKKIFQSLDNFQKDYNWLITDCEISTLNPVYTDRFHQEHTWMSGEELTDIIMQDDFQWIWGVLSGFDKSCSKEEVLNHELPYAEGYRGFWKEDISIQHPLASVELVAWDSALTLFISKNESLVKNFRKAFPLSRDLRENNKMNWTDTVKQRLKRKNQILFSADDELLQELSALIGNQNHRILVLWAFELAEEAVQRLEKKHPDESRPRTALEMSKLWAAGKVKMPEAKRTILDCHAVAKEISDLESIALCHAVGQACAVVHTAGHAMGFPIYDLTAVVRKLGIDRCEEAVKKRSCEYIDKILYWQSHYEDYSGDWADFMMK